MTLKIKISRKMPTYHQKGNIIHFAMHKKHIGLYVGASAVNYFAAELESHPYNEGTIQLPKDLELPGLLIENIIQFNVERHAAK